MAEEFVEVNPEDLPDNPFKVIGSQWMLVTAGTMKSFNTMTASWGGFGIMWAKKICACVVRPTRHTYGFMEKSDMFSLSFFTKEYKKALLFCGTHSGRDTDKMSETGLTPIEDSSSIYFKEARLVFLCRKIYYQDIDPGHFIDPSIESNYQLNDYHRMYLGEIIKCITKI
ncbi:flavin reductase [Candidatus Magnetominusculus xianensis]|uniref:Flavin reductase n=1 Tax=Candidatus Magnetominusculus xianensis TaxID=1748249 RepID=A0ABR5SJM3_9BACT|nr:flavin reductase [Candidatus Magnetominusculus xianensis]KWT92663.1 flavin reductase [Candidatus Magnetominusculus xianensis]MBF0403786.1 flavin reductase [Nitrospirota bacterium]